MGGQWAHFDGVASEFQAGDVMHLGHALLTAFTAMAEMEPGSYVKTWPSGTVSIEVDDVPIASLAIAVMSALKWEKAMAGRDANSIIHEAEALLKTAQFGLEDMRTRPARVKSGLHNVIVFGRAVTFALQNLSSAAPDFDAWYEPRRQGMREDPVASYFSELRTKIEKQAQGVPTTVTAHINFHTNRDMKYFYPKPDNATSLVIGDRNGGAGWVIKTESGVDEMYYVDLPPSVLTVHLGLSGAPALPGNQHPSAADLASAYLDGVAILIRDARERFGNPQR